MSKGLSLATPFDTHSISDITSTSFWLLSPEAMATSISALSNLFRLSIGFISPASRPDPTTRHPPSLTRAVLPTLVTFYFHGVSEYLEDLIAQIDTSHRDNNILQSAAKIFTYTNRVEMNFCSSADDFSFQILSRRIDWQVSSVAQICNQLSEPFIVSSIKKLYIFECSGMSPSTLEDEMDETQWLELFRPFTAVRTLCISHKIQSHVMSALRGLSGELAMQVLPAFEKLYLLGFHPDLERGDMGPFMTARQGSAHPVAPYRFELQNVF
ncbi:hypothetical protein BGW80DRAFT_1458504 [Lactifluus volemus]|nr:hypothetical protein BGW80DRAFT_1458504 [Lactifluus volemus]